MKRLPTLSVPLDRVEVQEHTRMKGTIGVVSGFLTPPVGMVNPRQVALQFTRTNADLIAGPYELDGRPQPRPEEKAVVRPSLVKRSPVGYHVQLQQMYQGIPIYGGQATVHMTEERSVYFYVSDLHPKTPEIEAGKAGEISAEEALEAVSMKLPWRNREESEPRCEKIYYPLGDDFRLAWCIDLSLRAQEPIQTELDRSSDWRAIVDAYTADLLELRDLSLYDAAWGYVFYPNPVVALRQENLSHDAQIPDGAYRKVILAGVDDSGFLRGPYADTGKTLNRAYEPSKQFLYKRGDPRFLEVMAYCFITRVMNLLRAQGWSKLFPKPLQVNAQAPLGDNSKFLPTSWEVRFGTGKVMDAEDASIILHELGHAIQEAQVPRWADCDKNLPVRAMGEGFGDWLATLYFAEERREFHPTYVGDWDARGYTTPRSYLRRVDSGKTMANWQGDEHADGEIWSAALWDLYLRLGGDSAQPQTRKAARDTALKIVLTSHQYLSDGMRHTLNFKHGLEALLMADRFISADVTKPGPHDQLIRDVFAARGITV
ncbi:MAG: M36 family metallopeptidase [Chloroflexi bacterium]|nr:M36 family metallopeptidase [Chloroflexota bacterium]